MRFGVVVLALAGCPAPAAPAPPDPGTSPPRIADSDERSTEALRLRVEARAPETGDVVRLLGGGSIVCARRHEADAACWGRVGLFDPDLSEHAGAPAAEDEPVTLDGFRHVVAVSGGTEGRCLLEADGQASCWGDPFAWSAAFEPLAPQPWPASGRIESVSVGRGVYAAVDGTLAHRGDPLCWAESIGGLTAVTRVAVGHDAACVLHEDGTLSCWNRECSGQPQPAKSVTRVVQVVASGFDACGRTGDGRVWCTGQDWTPLKRSVHLAAAGLLTCSLREDGAVHCWTSATPPERAGGLPAAVDLVVQDDRPCVLGVDRELVCFGAGSGPSITAAQWRSARPLWPELVRDDVVRLGAVQGFRAAANKALGELQYNLDRYCDAHDCSRRWPPTMGPTIADGDDALRGWPDLSPTDAPVEVFGGAEVTATRDGRSYVLAVSYKGDVFERARTLRSACHVRPRPAGDRPSFRRITCDPPVLEP